MESQASLSHRSLYVPVLRGKASEWDALGGVNPQERRRLLPLIELTPDLFAMKRPSKPKPGQKLPAPPKKRPDEIAREAIRRFAANAVMAATRGRLIVDVGHCGAIQFAASGVSIWESLLRHWPPGTRGIALTIRLGWPQRTAEAAGVLINRLGAGAALRLFAQDLVRPDLPGEIRRALATYGLSPEDVDLVVDFETDPNVLSYSALAKRLPFLDRWRTYTVTASVFPPDLSGFDPDATPEQSERSEWLTWWRQAGSPDEQGFDGRLPGFGDFTTQHGRYEPAVQAAGSYSLRYTDDTCIWVYRGYQPNAAAGRTGTQFLGHARQLRTASHYFGRNFSDADAFIYEKAQPGTPTTGNPGKWRTIGIMHHISATLAQLADPDGTSSRARAAAAASALTLVPSQQTATTPRRSARAARRTASNETRRQRPSE